MTTPPVSESIEAPGPASSAARTLFPILAAVSVCHLLNDMVQSLLPSIYPILKSTFKLDFSQIGLLSLTYQVVASLLQPFIGMFTDRRPVPFALAFGMCFTLAGIVLVAIVPTFGLLLFAIEPLVVGPRIRRSLACKPQQTIVRMQGLHAGLLVLSLLVIAAVVGGIYGLF